jgi:hypothetical protein
MKGLTLDQYKEIVEFVQKYHKFALCPTDEQTEERKKEFPKMGEYGLNIKYVDCVYDSRDATIWQIKFRQGRNGVCFSTNHWNAIKTPPKEWKYNNLYDLCMAYLKGEFIPKAEFYVDVYSDANENMEREIKFLNGVIKRGNVPEEEISNIKQRIEKLEKQLIPQY